MDTALHNFTVAADAPSGSLAARIGGRDGAEIAAALGAALSLSGDFEDQDGLTAADRAEQDADVEAMISAIGLDALVGAVVEPGSYSDGYGRQVAQPEPAGVAAAEVRAAPHRVVDRFTLFGDVPTAAREAAKRRFIVLSLHQWSSRHTVSLLATTDLLLLFHGGFGRHLGIRTELLRRFGEIPKTAQSLRRCLATLRVSLSSYTLSCCSANHRFPR